MSDTETLTAARVPTVYFIDDSATMREVIKIAFRKENIHVVTCPDAATAMAQFGETAPDAVITDVIMPDKDGYEVCQFIKQHEQLGRTPVILMSGVVNRSVAEKAMAVKADELIRKPFQPQDLIARVKNLLNPKSAGSTLESSAGDSPEPSRASLQTLSGLFSPGPAAPVASPVTPRAVSAPVVAAPKPIVAAPVDPPARLAPRSAPTSAESQKLRNEIRRLELLVRKLQAELEAEHKYCEALEAHFKTLQESE
ncbi:MAG TPA: response regulator [Candidatus Acidoferrales bacterium]|jgi:DNA-binding response OmpR family regulator|nr:response regulator [Candidatus Acidoferrales bacterium]